MEFVLAPFSKNLITFLASFLIWFLYLGLFLWFYFKKRTKKELLFILFSSLLAWVLSQMFKDLLPTARPFLLNDSSPLTLTEPQDNSFPSGHSASAFGLATAVFLIDKRLGIAYFLLAGLVAVGRILSRVHFLIDVLGGSVLGFFSALLLESLFFRGRKSRKKK